MIGIAASGSLVVREGRPVPDALAAVVASLAFEDFFEAERRRLFGAVSLMTGDPAEAEETVQDAFLAVWERWDRVRVMDRPAGYLYRTAMNLFRSRRRRLVRATKRLVPRREADDPFDAIDRHDEVVRAVRALPPRQRAALVLTELLDYSSAEAAEQLHVRPTTIRNLTMQARARLRTSMEEAHV